MESRSLWREQSGFFLYPASFPSASTVHPIRRYGAHLQWHHPLHICQRQWQISFSTPSVTKLLHSQSVLFLINQPGNAHIFLWPSQREIYHSAVDQIWHTPSFPGIRQGGYTHTVDLLAWYTGHSKIKYVPQGISNLSWNCHKPIFTARTRRNWKGENTAESWPSKQSSALKASLYSRIQICQTKKGLFIEWSFRQGLLGKGLFSQGLFRRSWSKD